MIKVELSNRQASLDVDSQFLIEAVQSVLEAEDVEQANISLAIVDDATIHELNRRFLSHDYATDVLSFLLSHANGHLEGEIVASADTAVCSAVDYNWPAAHELLLYVIHGMLHLLGYDDRTLEDRREMRGRESWHLSALGITPPRDHVFAEQHSDKSRPVGGGCAYGGVDK